MDEAETCGVFNLKAKSWNRAKDGQTPCIWDHNDLRRSLTWDFPAVGFCATPRALLLLTNGPAPGGRWQLLLLPRWPFSTVVAMNFEDIFANEDLVTGLTGVMLKPFEGLVVLLVSLEVFDGLVGLVAFEMIAFERLIYAAVCSRCG